MLRRGRDRGDKGLEVKEKRVKVDKTRNELKVSNSKTYPLKNEERMKNG